MSFFSALGSLAKGVGSGVGTIARGASKIPGVSMIPIVGTALGAAGTAASIWSAGSTMFGGSSSSGNSNGSLPMLPGDTGGFGVPRGPNGKMQLPWNDPSISANLKPHSLDDKYLRTYYKAPRGYIVMWDGGAPGKGRPFCVEKKFARTLHYANGAKVLKHHAKPPISVGEFHSLKKAHRTIKKVNKVHGLIKYVHDHTTTGGKVKIHHHKKGHAK